MKRPRANPSASKCFFRIEGVLRGRGEHYARTYGLYPSFKAGLHVGEATVGEIGFIKKDIVYSGDVLNPTSRIQAECNRHDVSLLLSAPLLERLPLNGEYSRILIGEIQLRGKTVTVALHAVRANTETLS